MQSMLILMHNTLIKNKYMKITVVGAGAVGASCAEYIAIKNFVLKLFC